MEILIIKNLKKTLQNTTVLNNINLTVKKGEIITLVGPSGSGKTTLLRCINRLIEPDQGIILFNNQNIKNLSPTKLRRQVTLVPQENIMFPGTVYDNIAYGLRIQGKTDNNLIHKSLQDAGLPTTFLRKNASRLSGGEKKRVSLARALVLQPQVLLLDEPTAGVDPKNVQTVEKHIINFSKQRQLTVLWVTHDITQAQRVSDRIANLKQGIIKNIKNADEFQWEGAY